MKTFHNSKFSQQSERCYCTLLICYLVQNPVSTLNNDASVQEFNLFHDSGKDGYFHACSGKMAKIVLPTWSRVPKQKQNFVRFLFANQIVHSSANELRYYCNCLYWLFSRIQGRYTIFLIAELSNCFLLGLVMSGDFYWCYNR